MNLDLSKAVIENLSTSNTEAIKEIIDDATTSKSETILPGLGVMFEVYWNNLNNSEKSNVVQRISQNLK